jgi:alpha-N-arabinofuranosidase
MKRLYLMAPEKIGIIKPELYGHFSEHIGGVIYDGIWVGKNSTVPNINGFRKELVEKLRKIKPPVLRWPGGCFSETYNWRDGIGPQDKRPIRINWWNALDGRYEPNEVGINEFVEFCGLIGAKPYIAANITSMTPLDIRNWIDYCNSPKGTTTFAKEREANGAPEPFNIRYWGIGNENWGGGGNMTPETYAHEFRKYAVVADNTSRDLCLIGCGANSFDYDWTKRFLEIFRSSEKHMKGLSIHYYCGQSGDPVNFNESEWYQLLTQANEMDTLVNRHWNIIKGFGMESNAALVVDEWGCWHRDGSGPSKGYNLFEQQSTMRDAVVSALTLNIFNNNCEKIMMANAAQLVNNLHTLFLAGGNNCITTPTYHVFDMFKEHQGGVAIKTVIDNEIIKYKNPWGNDAEIKKLSVSASVKDGYITLTAVNVSACDDETVELSPVGFNFEDDCELTVLFNDDYHAHNTFEDPEAVRPVSYKINLTKSGSTNSSLKFLKVA